MCDIIVGLNTYERNLDMKFLKLIALILAMVLALSFVACNDSITAEDETTVTEETTDKTTDETTDGTADETTDETTEETTEYLGETEVREDYVSFCSYTNDIVGSKVLKKTASCAMSFTIPDGQLTALSIRIRALTTQADTTLVVNLYKFTGDYDESVAAEPIRSDKVGTIFQTYTMKFEDGEVGKGDYLVVLSNESQDSSESTLLGTVWSKGDMPEEYAPYNLICYMNGSPTKAGQRALYGGFTIEHSVPKQEEETSDIVTEKDPEDVAKVIILSGQSNGVGTSSTAYLYQKLGANEYKKYSDGFENIKILYYSELLDASHVIQHTQHSDTFVNVKVGQGVTANMFGPELGLAAYLSETYPDETFYIIKYAAGGATIHDHFNPIDDGSYGECFVKLDQNIEKGLALLEAEGLTPKIVGMLWMQGESDANLASQAYGYYELETALIAHIREKFADHASVRGIAFIDAAITDSGMWSNFLALNYSKVLVSRDSHLNYFIDTNDYGLTTMFENNDFAHYDSESMLLLGRLFGETLSKAID